MNSVLEAFRRMSPCGDSLVSRLLCEFQKEKPVDGACRRRSTSGRRPPALISIGGLTSEKTFVNQPDVYLAQRKHIIITIEIAPLASSFGIMTRIQFQSSKEQKSMPENILDSIDLVHQRQSRLDKETLRHRAIELAGKYQSGVTDLSEAHDRYLAEAW